MVTIWPIIDDIRLSSSPSSYGLDRLVNPGELAIVASSYETVSTGSVVSTGEVV